MFCQYTLFLELFQLKFEEKWLHMYELAKVSINNRGNEIRSMERRSFESRENDENVGVENYMATSGVSENPNTEQVN